MSLKPRERDFKKKEIANLSYTPKNQVNKNDQIVR